MGRSQECTYEVAVGTHAIYIRVHGLASMNNCLSVRDFIEDMFDDEHETLVFAVSYTHLTLPTN